MARAAVEGTTSVRFVVLDAAADRLNDLAAQFANTSPEVSRRQELLVAGAGEFAGRVQVGSVKFMIGWREALGVCSTSAGLVAGNTHSYRMNLQQVDVDQQVTVTL